MLNWKYSQSFLGWADCISLWSYYSYPFKGGFYPLSKKSALQIIESTTHYLQMSRSSHTLKPLIMAKYNWVASMLGFYPLSKKSALWIIESTTHYLQMSRSSHTLKPWAMNQYKFALNIQSFMSDQKILRSI